MPFDIRSKKDESPNKDKLPLPTDKFVEQTVEGFKTVEDLPSMEAIPNPLGEADLPEDQKKAIEAMFENVKPQEPKEDTMSAGGAEESDFCKHCGWDKKKPELEDPDRTDKLNFVQAILGQIPFKKGYSLLKNRVYVEFRSLSSEESDLTFTQVAYDAGRGAILDEGQYFRTMTDYRMCLSLSRLDMGDQRQVLPASMAEWETDKPGPKATKLLQIAPWVYANILKSESIRRAVASSYYRFQRLVERLEAHMDDPNFWQAID